MATATWGPPPPSPSLPEAAALADQLAAVDILQRSATLGFVHPMVSAAIATETPAGERVHLQHWRRAGFTTPAPLSVGLRFICWPSRRLGSPGSSRRCGPQAAWRWRKGLLTSPAVRHLERDLAEPPVAAERPDVMRELGWRS